MALLPPGMMSGADDSMPAPAVPPGAGKPGGKASFPPHPNTQHHGSVIGRRGAGITAITGGDQTMHSINQYGKTPPMTLV